MKERWRQYGPLIAIGILVVLYTVGLIGMMGSHRMWFLSLTPLTLLISCSLMLATHRAWSWEFALVVLICLFTGFGVEVLGVHTGVIFGEYVYGPTLGWKWLDVPLIIACNWLLLTYASGISVARIRTSRLGKAAIAAGIMTALDLLIEPVAIHFDFWHWHQAVPPLQNYLAWYVVAFALSALFQYAHFKKRNAVGGALLILQFVFFGILNLLISWE